MKPNLGAALENRPSFEVEFESGSGLLRIESHDFSSSSLIDIIRGISLCDSPTEPRYPTAMYE
jgi:hypothetical protein